jgi:hypothetical protein
MRNEGAGSVLAVPRLAIDVRHIARWLNRPGVRSGSPWERQGREAGGPAVSQPDLRTMSGELREGRPWLQ